jgi:ATP-dependent DNA helicase RecG
VGPSDSVETLRGAGPKVRAALARHGISTIADLLWLLPAAYDDLRDPWSVARAVREAPSRARAVVKGRVRSARYVFGRGRRATRVELEDRDTPADRLVCFWFFAAKGILDLAQKDRDVVAVGRLSVPSRGGGALMTHPDIIGSESPDELVRPRYPYSGIPAGRHRALVAAALERPVAAIDPVPPDIAGREGLGETVDIAALHRPRGLPDPVTARRARERLAWAESFSRAWIRTERDGTRTRARKLPEAASVRARVESAFGFSLTPGQRQAAIEIGADLAREEPMRRLLVGDVGCGKTAVVALAIAQVVAGGGQALVLAPTTILAEQYSGTFASLAGAMQARVETITGAASAAERRSLEARVGRGEVDVVVGTHLLQDAEFVAPRLALVVVDEQQRLGVLQRLTLSGKGTEFRPHLLTVSATPIPRTLALALRGEISTSEIRDLPAGRRPVATELVGRDRFDDVVIPSLEVTLSRGEAALCVCPRIEADPDEDGGASATETFARLRERFGDRVVLGHGKLPEKDLFRSMERLRSGDAGILVGTTIVEVGLDLPRATLMVVDGAERFGLSQLHQLRGRVGRSDVPSRCLLIHDSPLTPQAAERLEALVRLNSGAEIARADLELRGAGDLGGVRQSGDSGLLYLDGFFESGWLERIPEQVARLRSNDPKLERPEHALLRLFVERLPSRLSVREEAG